MKTIVGLHLSNDAAACLADNQIDLFTELRRELQRDGATVERSAWPADTRQRDQEKSPELVILVAGVTTVWWQRRSPV
jgi:hypothetical protein